MNRERFSSFHLDVFYFFFFVIALIRASSTMLNRNSESWYLCFVPDIRCGVGSIQSFIIELAVSFLYMLLIIFEDFFLNS